MPKIERVNSELEKELTELVNNELNDPRISAYISILRVDTTKDLKYATVHFSAICSADERKVMASVLNKSAGFLKKELFHRLRIRAIPNLIFKAEDVYEKAEHINKLINSLNIKAEEKAEDKKEDDE